MYPLLTTDLSKIEHNARTLVELCQAKDIGIIGVTKGCLGSERIARAMLSAGVRGIGDSRLASLLELAKAKITPLMMLRQPMTDEVEEVVKAVDISLISELDAAVWLSRAAFSAKKEHSIILMVETGDLREGALPHELPGLIERILDLPYLRLLGIGTNVACLEGAPSTNNLELLLELSERIEKEFVMEIETISGGNSSALKLFKLGGIPGGVNQFRIGEGILLGQDTVDYEPVEGLYQDAFVLSAEVIEVGRKGKDFSGSGSGSWRKQAVLALGRQDVADGLLKPLTQGVEILKRSSDHLVVDLSHCAKAVKVGDILRFIPGYFAVLAAMTSPFVKKDFVAGLVGAKRPLAEINGKTVFAS